MDQSVGTGTMGLADAAMRLGVPYGRAYKYVLIGRLEATKADNGRYRVKISSVEQLVEQRKLQPAA